MLCERKEQQSKIEQVATDNPGHHVYWHSDVVRVSSNSGKLVVIVVVVAVVAVLVVVVFADVEINILNNN